MALLAFAVPGGAQEDHGTTVQANALGGNRLFFVEDLAGNDLTTLTLPLNDAVQLFRVRVQDTNIPLVNDGLGNDNGFTVDARINNLYLEDNGSYDFATFIPSDNVRLASALSPVAGLIDSLLADPLFLLDGAVSCDALRTTLLSLLGLTLLDFLLSPISGLFNQVCPLIGGTVAVDDLPIVGEVLELIPTILDLPMSLVGGADQGAFTDPDYQFGIGTGDPAAAGSATVREVLSGIPLESLPSALLDHLFGLADGIVGALPLVSETGQDALFSLQQVLNALMAEGYGSLANLLQELGVANAVSLLNDTLALVATLDVLDILGLAASWMGFPGLAVEGPAPVAGLYEGTLTVTFIQH